MSDHLSLSNFALFYSTSFSVGRSQFLSLDSEGSSSVENQHSAAPWVSRQARRSTDEIYVFPVSCCSTFSFVPFLAALRRDSCAPLLHLSPPLECLDPVSCVVVDRVDRARVRSFRLSSSWFFGRLVNLLGGVERQGIGFPEFSSMSPFLWAPCHAPAYTNVAIWAAEPVPDFPPYRHEGLVCVCRMAPDSLDLFFFVFPDPFGHHSSRVLST